MVRDMRLQECKMFDREDRLVGKVLLPPRGVEEAPRHIVFQGRTFLEGDGSGFYGENEFSEIVETEKEKQ